MKERKTDRKRKPNLKKRLIEGQTDRKKRLLKKKLKKRNKKTLWMVCEMTDSYSSSPLLVQPLSSIL